MTASATLAGCSVLVVEDDYYLATDAQIALAKAGATVVGPSARTDEGLSLLDQRRPDCAVLDINLGSGPCFVLARELRTRSVPFVFVTGYDASIIPPGVRRHRAPGKAGECRPSRQRRQPPLRRDQSRQLKESVARFVRIRRG
jgi:CheY-like chemotaxis protein